MKLLLTLAYIATIFAANWAIQRFGVVPVGLGLSAPAGVYFAGLALTLRDGLQEVAGRRWVLVAILLGALVSLCLGGQQLAVASGLAFLVSELADWAVYTPLRHRSWLAAVLASNTVGAIVDSALFLWLAGFSLALLPGQVAGKLWVTALAVALIAAWRRLRRPRAAEVMA